MESKLKATIFYEKTKYMKYAAAARYSPNSVMLNLIQYSLK